MRSKELFFVFVDDSKQNSPQLKNAGPLVAVGGLIVPAEHVWDTTREIGSVAKAYGFPINEEFKWSPPKKFWMRENLKGDQKREFFEQIVNTLHGFSVRAVVVVVDATCSSATGTPNPELDATTMFMERIDNFASRENRDYVVVADRPPGGRSDEDSFILDCLTTLQKGTEYVNFENVAHGILTSPSRYSRPLQCADFITAATLSMVSGNKRLARLLFPSVSTLLLSSGSRVAGIGLKVHPDAVYGNLYHWLLGTPHLEKRLTITRLPQSGPYDENPYSPWTLSTAAEAEPDYNE